MNKSYNIHEKWTDLDKVNNSYTVRTTGNAHFERGELKITGDCTITFS